MSSRNGFAVAGFVLGLVAAVTAVGLGFGINVVVMVLTFLPSVLGIVFGFIGVSVSKRTQSGRGLATWGIVLGFVALFGPFLRTAIFGA